MLITMDARRRSTRARRAVAATLGPLLALALSAPARAQEPATAAPSVSTREHEAAAHLAAGLAHQRGEPGGDPEGFERCATAYLAVFNEVETHPRPDWLLAQAGECARAAGHVAQATQLWTTLVERYPDSQLAAPTLLSLAALRSSIADYPQAAARYEQFADRFPKHDRGPEALQNAFLLRVGLDQPDAAAHDLEVFERLYRRRDPARAAEVFWSRHALLDSWQARRAHALDYLERHGQHSARDQQIVAEAVIAQIDWRRSCREPLLLDTCISVEREPIHRLPAGVSADDLARIAEAQAQARAEADAKAQAQAGSRRKGKPRPREPLPTRCGDDSMFIVTVHPRNPGLAASAQDRLARLELRLQDGYQIETEIPADAPQRLADFREAWGLVSTYRADRTLEAFLQVPLPSKLDTFVNRALEESSDPRHKRRFRQQFARADAARQRFRDYYQTKLALALDLEARYADVHYAHDEHWTMAAAARVGFALQAFADQMRRAKVPRSLTSQSRVRSYCNALDRLAEPVLQRAKLAWIDCLERAIETQHFSEHARACEAMMTEFEPWLYPATRERFGAPSHGPTRMRSVGVVSGPRPALDP